jgi:uncharacterized Tic20 family protein
MNSTRWRNGYLESSSLEELERQLSCRYYEDGKEKLNGDGLTQLFIYIFVASAVLIILAAWPLSLMFGSFLWIIALFIAFLPILLGIIFGIILISEVINIKQTTKALKVALSNRSNA